MKPISYFITVTIGTILCQSMPVRAGDYVEKYESYPVDADYEHASPAALEAWRDRKCGMRIVWGVYSMLGVQASWPLTGGDARFREKYQEPCQNFNPTEFSDDHCAELMKRCGFNDFTFITKHHDGFAMWDTQTKVRRRCIQSGPKAGQIQPPGLGGIGRAFAPDLTRGVSGKRAALSLHGMLAVLRSHQGALKTGST